MPATYRVTATSLHLRTAPSIEADILGVLPRDLTLTVNGESEDKRWLNVTTRDERTGWVSQKHVAAVVEPDHASDYPWWPIAQRELGVKEAAGPADNPRIVQYLRSTTLDAPTASNDETPWCSAFVNWCVEQSGYEGTNSAAARSWLHWGRSLERPTLGCIVVLTREGGGHVGFYAGEEGDNLLIFGGNQSNAVRVSPYAKTRLLGYRAPIA